MTLEELGRRMGAAEFQERLAFATEYGLADGFFVAGQVCTTVQRAFTGADVEPADFVPYFRVPKPPQTPAEARAIVRAHLDAARRRKPRE
jgi:hypothetical protein